MTIATVQRQTYRRTAAEAGTSTGSGRMTDARLSWHLDNWARWMRGGRVTDGFPRQSAGMSSGGKSVHFDELANASERKVAAACNAIINDLPPAQYAAISCEYLHAVYRFPRGNQAECLERGRDGVRSGLESRGVW